jgi:hypothetical protein
LATALGCAFSQSVRAELVVNGGFETGTFASWTESGTSGWTSLDGPHSGSYGWDEGAVGGLHYISQTLATTAGTTYNVDFWLNPYGGTVSDYFVSFDGVTLMNVVNEVGLPTLTFHEWNYIQLTGVATGATSVLTLGIRQDPSYSQLDDISVTEASGVPEASSTLGLLGLALAGLVAAKRKFN